MVASALLLDIDEVVIDWSRGFHAWMAARGHRRDPDGVIHWDLGQSYPTLVWRDIEAEISAFARSPEYRALEPHKGVAEALAVLAAAGVPIHAVTCCGRDGKIVEGRRHQLRGLPIAEIHALEHSEPKTGVYGRFPAGSIVVDDHPKHLRAAEPFGHIPVAYDAPWNQGADAAARIYGWSAEVGEIFRSLLLEAAA